MFKDNLIKVNDRLNAFTGDKSNLMFEYIQRKLNRSFENYAKEIDAQINYILSKDEEKVQKSIDKNLRNNK